MVDQPLRQANRPCVYDSIQVFVAPKRLDNTTLREKYLSGNLSAAQIGEEFGLSKQTVLGRLRQAGVSKSPGRGRSQENYRFPNPAFGHRVVKGRLESNPREMKIARLIVELRDRQGLSFGQVAEELRRRNLFTRQGAAWTRYTASRVYRLRAGKL